MSVSFDAVNGGNGVSASSISFSHTISGSDNALMVGEENANGGGAVDAISGVDWGGASLTQLVNDNFGGALNQLRLYVYGLIAPGTGTKTLTVNYITNGELQSVGAVSFNGAHQTTPFGTAQALVSGSGTSASTTVTTTSGDMAAGFCAAGWRTQSASAGTLRISQTDGVNLSSVGIATEPASGSSTVVTLDQSVAGFSTDYGIRGIPILQAGGGGGSSPLIGRRIYVMP